MKAAPHAVNRVEIIGLDYAFRALPHIKAGPTTFAFVSRGKKRHEFNLSLLAVGATSEQVMQALRDNKPTRGLIEKSVGVLFAKPGETAPATLTTTMLAGRTYMAICIFKDTATAPRHHQLGMVTVIRPEGAATNRDAAVTTDTIIARDYAFEYPRTLAAGHHRFVFVNRGAQRHEVSLSRFKPGASVARLAAVDKAGGDVDSLFDANFGVLHSYGGKSPAGAIEFVLLPGRDYYIECGFQDDDKKPEHYKLGMFGSIRVLPARAQGH